MNHVKKIWSKRKTYRLSFPERPWKSLDAIVSFLAVNEDHAKAGAMTMLKGSECSAAILLDADYYEICRLKL